MYSKMIEPPMESSAGFNSDQVGLRRNGVEHIIQCLKEKMENQVNRYEQEFSIFFEKDREWAVHILIQGAYIREYHLWERLCKKHFSLKSKKKEKFTETVQKFTNSNNFQIPPQIIIEIEKMRDRVNLMKHDANIEMDRAVSFGEFELAAIAIESFWETICGQESHSDALTHTRG